MKFFIMILGVVLFSHAASAKGYGDKAGYMEFCTTKQSQDYCQCTVDLFFDKAQATLLEYEKKKITSREEQLKGAQEYSMRLDPAMTVERLNSYCDVSDEFYDAKEAYYFKETGYKKPPHTDQDQRQHVMALQEKSKAKMNALHAQYGSNETTISHMNSFGGGVCTQRRMLAKESLELEEYIKKDKAGDVAVNYSSVYKSGLSRSNDTCIGLFVK